MKLNKYNGTINNLGPKDVFVFGSNLQGFHGAGAAGYASFGVFGNKWGQFNYYSKPIGWKGKWNVKGTSEGLQAGTEGYSYAIPTVYKAGLKRSRSIDEITGSIRRMYTTAALNPYWRFLVAQSTKGGLNGYTAEEMAEMFRRAGPIPENVWFEVEFAKLIEKGKYKSIW